MKVGVADVAIKPIQKHLGFFLVHALYCDHEAAGYEQGFSAGLRMGAHERVRHRREVLANEPHRFVSAAIVGGVQDGRRNFVQYREAFAYLLHLGRKLVVGVVDVCP